jgi:hypothetical protein
MEARMQRDQTYNPIEDLQDVRTQLSFLSASSMALAQHTICQLDPPDDVQIHPGDVMVALGRQLRELATRVDRALEASEKVIRATAGVR